MLTPEVYSSIQRRPMDFSDYIDVARRYRGWILAPVFAGIVIGSVVALLLPNTYISQASLRISPAAISEKVLPSIASQEISDRINQMEQDILSRTSLSELIQRPSLNLYKTDLEAKPLDDVIERMRTKDIRIQVVRLVGQSERPASAFTIAFSYPDRYKAQAVVNAMVARFVDANQATQRASGIITSDFIREQVQQAKADLDRLNNELTEFRQKNAGRLPEELQVNAQALTSLQSQRASLDDALNRDSQEKIILESKLDTIRSQKDTYGSIAQQNFDESPQGGNETVRDLKKAVSETEVQLAAKRETYTDSHPDVQALQATLAALKRRLADAEKEDEKPAAPGKSSGSRRASAYVTAQLSDMDGIASQTRSQLKALEVDRQSKLKELDQINAQVSAFQGRLESGPANQQRYLQLMSDQQQANQHYQDMVKRQGLTEENQDAQTRKAGENLEVLDPASLPVSPTAPNRWMIVFIGFGAGVIAGLGLVTLREIKDTSLKNLKDVRAYTQLPILSSIPLLENDLLVQRRRRFTYVSWSAAVLAGAIAISGSMYYHFFISQS